MCLALFTHRLQCWPQPLNFTSPRLSTMISPLCLTDFQFLLDCKSPDHMTKDPKYAVEMRGITKRFGDVLANDHISLAIPDQSIHAIIGENGAGKSTVMNILYGFYKADEGEILIDGEPRSIDRPADAIKLGLGMVHQHFMLVEPLTVTENIVLGAEPTSGLAIDYRNARARVREISEL